MTLLRQPSRFTSVTVMLQLEVVQRLMAVPGTKAYNSLSVEAQSRGRPVLQRSLKPGAFHPPPKVDSAIVRFDVYEKPKVGTCGPEVFDQVVRAAFAQRRKTLKNSLSTRYPKALVVEALQRAEIEPGLRAEVLDLESLVRLAEALTAFGATGSVKGADGG